MKNSRLFSKLKTDRPFRWYALSGISLFTSLAFTAYNFYVGVNFKLVWNFSIAFYYVALTAVKCLIHFKERKYASLEEDQKREKRITAFKSENALLLLIDLTLIAPIILLQKQAKPTVDIGMIPTITLAAYTTYRIIMACVNYNRTKKWDNLALHAIKTVSLKEAIVSIITLQNTMIVVFGDFSEMLTLTFWTNIGMWLSLVVISAMSIAKQKSLTL